MFKSAIKTKIILGLASCLFLVSCLSSKEKAENLKTITKAIEQNNFKFVAQQVMPLRGGFVSQRLLQLDGGYSLKITPDTIDCHLPFFGVAQQVDYGSTDNGVQFISTDFTYDKKLSKKGGYEITIVPAKTNKARRLFLTISESGTAILNVNSNTRDAISYNGIIETNQ